jgi:hypothetical protein
MVEWIWHSHGGFCCVEAGLRHINALHSVRHNEFLDPEYFDRLGLQRGVLAGGRPLALPVGSGTQYLSRVKWK